MQKSKCKSQNFSELPAATFKLYSATAEYVTLILIFNF